MRVVRCAMVLLVAMLASACGGGGGNAPVEAADATGPPVAADTAGTEPTTGDTADAGELPAFMGDFDRVCTTQVGFPGAASYNNEPSAHPIQLFEEFEDDGGFLETSRTLPKAWVVTQDSDFEDNSELAAVELIGCSEQVEATPNGTDCEFDNDDGDKITLELVDGTFNVTIYEAATGAEVASETITAQSTDCPMFVSYQQGDTQYFNKPSDDQLIKILKPVVAP
jgi:hypothetical protein